MKLHEQIELEALFCFNRFRFVRTIDIAAHCFSERAFNPAQQAAWRAINNLLERKYVLKYLSEHKQTFYAMTDAGARHLRLYDLDAIGSARRAAALTNPTHTLWINFVVLTCFSRGLQAFSERDIMRELSAGKGDVTNHQNRGLLEVTPVPMKAMSSVNHNESEKISEVTTDKVSLLPDAIATEDDGITWFEIDASMRGSARIARLVGLVRKVGEVIPSLAKIHQIPKEESRLKRVSVHTTNPAYLRRIRTRLMEVVKTTKDEVLTESAQNFRVLFIGNDTFEVHRAGDTPTGQADFCVGHIILQMLPTNLTNYKHVKGTEPESLGWFQGNHLPYRRPACFGTWVPCSPIFPLKLTEKSSSR
ncbi:hypothetical protein GTP46_11215 [Duganella sp. FT135W]|uniref:Uncharacterized protein n=1 Tax=Duganella flavida TaxID=2692175 RepID=A0A6L8K860_9BURK|nr:hypothetical protein [Duganella flavida]MYM23215.1 hypothetical protein [Duganella flavida]